jgi:hypothetical protein
MSPDDLHVVDPTPTRPATLSELARPAAARLRHAADVPPPPMRSTTTNIRFLQIAAVIITAVIIATAALTTTGDHHQKPTAPRPPVTAAQTSAATTRFIDNLASGRFQPAEAQLAPSLVPLLDPLALRAGWQRVIGAYGPFKSADPPAANFQGNPPGLGLTATITLARGKVELGISFTAAGQIQTFGIESLAAVNSPSLSTDSLLSKAAATIRTLAAGDYQTAIATLDPLSATTPSELRRRWQQTQQAYGPFQSQGTPTISDANPIAVNVPVTWAKAHTTVIVAFTNAGQLNRLVPLRPDSPPGALIGQLVTPNPAAANLAATAAADLRAGRYADLAPKFSSLGAPSATATQLAQNWLTITARLGHLRHVDQPVLLGYNEDVVAYEIGITFDHGSAHIQVSIDDQHRYQDLLIEPGPPTRQLGQ